MKEFLIRLIRSHPDPSQRRNLAREYLQALQRSGAMIPWAFQGGTALRFLYGIARYSEDLDFALERRAADAGFRSYLELIRSRLPAEGYHLSVKMSDRRTVHSAFIRFQGLPRELGLSSQPDESLSVKIKVDTRPPAGAGLETDLVRRHLTLRLQHHGRASLLAGKLHALLSRDYAKGQDLYDLAWYLSDPAWPEPNLLLLRNALAQTGWRGPAPEPGNWRGLALERLEAWDWKAGLADVRPFLERPEETDLLTPENLTRLLRRKG